MVLRSKHDNYYFLPLQSFELLVSIVNLSSVIKSKSYFDSFVLKLMTHVCFTGFYVSNSFFLVSNFLACQTKYLTFFYFLTSNSVRSYFNSKEGNLTEKEKKREEGK